MTKSILFLGLVLGAASAAVGCSAGAGPESDGAELADPGVLDEALGEAGCGTVACTGPDCLTFGNPLVCGGSTFAQSPTINYGTPACPNQFMGRTLNIPATPGHVYPNLVWVGSPLTPQNCATARVEVGVYKRIPAAGAVPLFQAAVYTGVVVQNACQFNGPLLLDVAGASEVRIAAKATLAGAKQPIRVGFKRSCP